MINRVLIRIKTVQLLYSYLLVQNPFSLESQPTPLTKEKRFAYDLYLDTLYLLYRLARQVKGPNKSYPLIETRFIKKLELTEQLHTLSSKYKNSEFPFSPIEERLTVKIKESILFREFCNNKEDHSLDKIWEEIYKSIILPDSEFNESVSKLPLFSLSGAERAKEMVNETFKKFYSTRDNIKDAVISLNQSLELARELYMRLLDLPVQLTKIRKNQLSLNRKKYLASAEDLNPNVRFVDNILPKLIENNPRFSEYIEKKKLSWTDDHEILDILLKDILSSEIYNEYMKAPETDKKKDIEIWRNIFRDIILSNPDFLEFMENKSIFWNDDLEITSTFLFKTFKKFEDGDEVNAILPMYKDEEDARFGSELFKFVVENKDIYRGYINKILQNDKWETDRLAFMDVVITMTALAEILNFPKIPLVASINEYIEIAKSYSTSKSGSFVNGLLASVIENLKKEGKLIK